MLSFGIYAIDDVFAVRKALPLDESPTIKSHINTAIEEHLNMLLGGNNIDKIKTLVESKLLDRDDVIQLAVKNNYRDVLHELASPVDKEKLAKIVSSGEWDKIKETNLEGVDVSEGLLKAVKLGQRNGGTSEAMGDVESEAIKDMLKRGTYKIEDLLKLKKIMKPGTKLSSLLDRYIDKMLFQFIDSKNVQSLNTIVKDSSIKVDHLIDLIYNEGDMELLSALAKSPIVQNRLLSANDVDTFRFLVSKDILKVEDVIKLGENNGNQVVFNEFKNLGNQKIKSFLPVTTLEGTYVPPSTLTQKVVFDPKNYPTVKLKGIVYKPLELLGGGADGQVILYQDVNDAYQQLAVKIAIKKTANFRLENPRNEEAHLTRKANLLEGTTAISDNGFSFTPVKLIKGKPYATVLEESKEYVNPDDVLKQLTAILKAIDKTESNGMEQRDLHRKNIMYDPITDKATIIDFGRGVSSTIKGENGDEFNLNPYADKVRFLQDMRVKVNSLKNENSKLGYNYEKVETFLSQNLLEAKQAAQVRVKSVDELKRVIESKNSEFDKLKDQLNTLNSGEKNEAYWMKVKEISKEQKRLARELKVLENNDLLTTLGVDADPKKREKMFFMSTAFKRAKPNEVGNLPAEYQTNHANAEKVKILNENHNNDLNKAHETFQQAKLELRKISKSKEASE